MPSTRKNGDAALETPPNVHHVAIRIAPFYPEKPVLWFSQMEGQFALAKITADAEKFNYAMSYLEPIYAAEVEDIITAPPDNDKYVTLKTELIKRLSASREKKIQQLMTHEEIGDRKPSHFLRHLQQLAGPEIPEEFLRTVWTSRLPTSTQRFVTSQPQSTLKDMAELADRLQEIIPPIHHVAAAVSSTSLDTVAYQIAELARQVGDLITRMDRMERTRPQTTGSASTGGFERNRSRSRSRTRSLSNAQQFPTCFYHAKFGNNATKCMKPCDFSGKA